jgi:hypothetical protein
MQPLFRIHNFSAGAPLAQPGLQPWLWDTAAFFKKIMAEPKYKALLSPEAGAKGEPQ